MAVRNALPVRTPEKICRGCCTMCSSPFFSLFMSCFSTGQSFSPLSGGQKKWQITLIHVAPARRFSDMDQGDRRGLSGNPRWCCKTAQAFPTPQQGSTPGIGNISRLCRLLFLISPCHSQIVDLRIARLPYRILDNWGKASGRMLHFLRSSGAGLSVTFKR